jgi:hypothetical protein
VKQKRAGSRVTSAGAFFIRRKGLRITPGRKDLIMSTVPEPEQPRNGDAWATYRALHARCQALHKQYTDSQHELTIASKHAELYKPEQRAALDAHDRAVHDELALATREEGAFLDDHPEVKARLEREFRASAVGRQLGNGHGGGNGTGDGEADPRATADAMFHFTETGLAERFAHQHGTVVRWCETWGKWLVFVGTHWEEDAERRVRQFAKATVRNIYKEAAAADDGAQRAALAKYALRSETFMRYGSCNR